MEAYRFLDSHKKMLKVQKNSYRLWNRPIRIELPTLQLQMIPVLALMQSAKYNNFYRRFTLKKAINRLQDV